MQNLRIQLENLHTHEVLVPVFEERKLSPPWPLEVVLEELGKLGEPLLGAHDEETGKRGIDQSFICSLKWRMAPSGDSDLLIASGETPVLAALYCLMEALYAVRKSVTADTMAD